MQHYRLTSDELVESDIIRQCLDLLVMRGWLPLRLHCGALKSPDGRHWVKLHPKGTPDYIVTHWHYPAFFLETKRPKGGVISDTQAQRHREITRQFNVQILVCDDAYKLARWLTAYETAHGPAPVLVRLRL
jgi:hypothetical protein